ncbi:unnamed protein product [Mytilus edulis]|uniref:Uncharacterized protein n=1 Tax=Mytilus edulis TaxID=6550 RepID=A0A8S3U3Q8_MYTED|nr:unnamed protein product [Mytilus edulis]
MQVSTTITNGTAVLRVRGTFGASKIVSINSFGGNTYLHLRTPKKNESGWKSYTMTVSIYKEMIMMISPDHLINIAEKFHIQVSVYQSTEKQYALVPTSAMYVRSVHQWVKVQDLLPPLTTVNLATLVWTSQHHHHHQPQLHLPTMTNQGNVCKGKTNAINTSRSITTNITNIFIFRRRRAKGIVCKGKTSLITSRSTPPPSPTSSYDDSTDDSVPAAISFDLTNRSFQEPSVVNESTIVADNTFNDVPAEELVTTYTVINRGTEKGRDKLVDNRSSRKEHFVPGPQPHNHPAVPGSDVAVRISAEVKSRAAADMFEPAAAIVEQVVQEKGDPALPAGSRQPTGNL